MLIYLKFEIASTLEAVSQFWLWEGASSVDPIRLTPNNCLEQRRLERRGRPYKDVLSQRTEPEASQQPVFDYLWLLFAQGAQWICGTAEKISVRFRQRSVAGARPRRQSLNNIF